jgi:hypothetical protein
MRDVLLPALIFIESAEPDLSPAAAAARRTTCTSLLVQALDMHEKQSYMAIFTNSAMVAFSCMLGGRMVLRSGAELLLYPGQENLHVSPESAAGGSDPGQTCAAHFLLEFGGEGFVGEDRKIREVRRREREERKRKRKPLPVSRVRPVLGSNPKPQVVQNVRPIAT